MENIAIKVIYKGKIIIIGKGIRTEQSIVNELQKRFSIPEEQINLFSIQYEDGAKDINEAYDKAYQMGKQSIRIKIQLVKPQDRFIQMKNYNVAVLPKKNHQDLEPKYNESDKFQKMNKESQKEEPHVVFKEAINKVQPQLQTKNTIQQFEVIDTKPHTDDNFNEFQQIQRVPNEGELYIPLVSQAVDETEEKKDNKIEETKIFPITKIGVSQHCNNPNEQNESSQESPLLQEQAGKQSKETIQNQQQQSQQEQSEKSSRNLLQDPNKQKQLSTNCYGFAEFLSPTSNNLESQCLTYPNLQIKKEPYESFSFQHQHQHQNLGLYQNYSQIPTSNQQIETQPIDKLRSQLRRQFDDKLLLFEKRQIYLEKQNIDLQQKYNDLLQKYNALTFVLQQNLAKNQNKQKKPEKKQKQYQKKKPCIKDYQKPRDFDLLQMNQLQQEDQQDEPKVDIQDIDNKSQYEVGEKIRPNYFLVNTGSKKWPQDVFVFTSQGKTMKIKSLEPREETILQLNEIIVGKQDTQIKEKYSLAFYNQKGVSVYFGRRFGINAKVVDGKILKEKKNSLFNFYIHELMKKNNIKKKNLQVVVNYLKNMGLNERNYKQVDKSYLIDVINYME